MLTWPDSLSLNFKSAAALLELCSRVRGTASLSRLAAFPRILRRGVAGEASAKILYFLLTVVFATVVNSLCATASDTKAVWGAHAGDRFLVSVVIVKQTEVTVGDQPPIISHTTDKMRIEYRIVEVSTAGDAVVVAALQRPSRETSKLAPGSLKSAAAATGTLEDLLVVLRLDSEGVVKQVSPSDKDSILAHVSNHDPVAERVLQHACPEEVIASWFGRPFWIACGSDAARQGHTWHRDDDIAAGPFGRLRNSNEIRIATLGGHRTSLEISGTGRFVPLVIPEGESEFRSSILQDVTAELEASSGKAEMFVHSTDEGDSQPIRTRPQFESLELTIRLQGRGTLPSNESGGPQPVTFQQTQVQSWNLVDFEFGRPEFLFNVPVPADAK